MEENDKPDGSTAMELLARELIDELLGYAVTAYSWCKVNGISVVGSTIAENIGRARADMERRIEDARAEDDCADSYAAAALKALTGMHRGHAMCTRGEVDEMAAVAECWKAEAAELDALCRVLNAESADEAAAVARALAEEHYELKELREACRIMPEGVSWPRYEDGEPVRMGDPFVTWDGQASEVRSVTLYTPGPDAAWAINAGSCRNFVGGSDEAHRMHGLRLKRPAPKAVGADGVEVKPGETVWLAREHLDKADMSPSDSGFECGLLGVGALDPLSVKLVGKKLDKDGLAFFTEHSAWCPASWLTHERPDSWERLREDAAKIMSEYWGCAGHHCEECPSKVGGKTPAGRYGVDWCDEAMRLDIVARAERLAGVRGDE